MLKKWKIQHVFLETGFAQSCRWFCAIPLCQETQQCTSREEEAWHLAGDLRLKIFIKIWEKKKITECSWYKEYAQCVFWETLKRNITQFADKKKKTPQGIHNMEWNVLQSM